jgi:hypothetical protein
MKHARNPMMKHLVAALALLLALSNGARAEAVRIMAAFAFKNALDEAAAVSLVGLYDSTEQAHEA